MAIRRIVFALMVMGSVLFAQNSFAAFGDVVQQTTSGTAASTQTCTISAATTGNLLIMATMSNTASATVSTPPSGMTLLTDHTSSGDFSAAWYYKISTGGETSLQTVWSGGSGTATCIEYAYSTETLGTVSTNEDTSQVSGGPYTSQGTNSVTPDNATNIVLAFITGDSSSNIDTSPSWTNSFSPDQAMITQGSPSGAIARRVSVTGSQSTTYSVTDTGDQMYGAIASFSASGGAALACSFSDTSPAPGATVTITCSDGDASNIASVQSPDGTSKNVEAGASATSASWINWALSDFVSGGSAQNVEWSASGTWTVTNVGTQTANVTAQVDPPETAGPDYWFGTLTGVAGDSVCPGAAASGDEYFVDEVTGTITSVSTTCSVSASTADFETNTRIWDESANGGLGQWSAVTNTVFDGTPPSGYSVTIDQDPINDGNSTSISFTWAGAEVGASYNYSFSSSGGGGPVAGSGTISTATDQITAINLSPLSDGTVTITAYLTDAASNQGDNATDTATKSTTAVPSGYTVSFDPVTVGQSNEDAISFTWAGAEVAATYACSITSSGGAGTVSPAGTIATATDNISNIDVSTLPDGTLTLSCTLTNGDGTGSAAQDTVVKETVAPSGYSITVDQSVYTAANYTTASFTFAGAEVGATYVYTVEDGDGIGGPVSGGGTISTATDQITGIDLTPMADGTLSWSVTLTDTYGNTGTAATDSTPKDLIDPTSSNAVIRIADNTLRVRISENVVAGAGGTGGFTLTSCSGGAVTPTYSTGSSSSVLQFTLSRTVTAAETGCVVGYTQPGNGWEDSTVGNDLATFASLAVTFKAACLELVNEPSSDVTQDIVREIYCTNH